MVYINKHKENGSEYGSILEVHNNNKFNVVFKFKFNG